MRALIIGAVRRTCPAPRSSSVDGHKRGPDVQTQNTNATRQTKTLAIAPLHIHYLPGIIHVHANDWQVNAVRGSAATIAVQLILRGTETET